MHGLGEGARADLQSLQLALRWWDGCKVQNSGPRRHRRRRRRQQKQWKRRKQRWKQQRKQRTRRQRRQRQQPLAMQTGTSSRGRSSTASTAPVVFSDARRRILPLAFDKCWPYEVNLQKQIQQMQYSADF